MLVEGEKYLLVLLLQCASYLEQYNLYEKEDKKSTIWVYGKL